MLILSEVKLFFKVPVDCTTMMPVSIYDITSVNGISAELPRNFFLKKNRKTMLFVHKIQFAAKKRPWSQEKALIKGLAPFKSKLCRSKVLLYCFSMFSIIKVDSGHLRNDRF